MRLMSLPGFSAETSIGWTGAGTYRSSGRSYAAAPTAIMTQAPGDPGGWGVDFGGNPNQRACPRCTMNGWLIATS